MPEHNPGGIRVFGHRIPPNRVVFFVLAAFIQVSVIWPVYALFSSPEPFILGFPLSFAWLIFILLLAFAALVYLYITDYRDDDTGIREEEEG